jgi:hypothetical protein
MTNRFDHPDVTPFPPGTVGIYPKELSGYFFAAPNGKFGIALGIEDKKLGHFAIVLDANHIIELHDFTSRTLALDEHDMQAICAQVHSINPEDTA